MSDWRGKRKREIKFHSQTQSRGSIADNLCDCLSSQSEREMHCAYQVGVSLEKDTIWMAIYLKDNTALAAYLFTEKTIIENNTTHR